MLNIEVAVEADEDILEEMAIDPEAGYELHFYRRDATYLGSPDDDLNSTVGFQVRKKD